MKSLNLHAVGDLRLDDLPIPEPQKDEVLVKVKYCGICGSDIPRVFSKGTYHFPTVIGHEFSGVVAHDPEGKLDGCRVAVFPLLPCFSCASCKKETYASCENYDYYGSRRDGGMAEYIAVKRWNLMPLPDNVGLDIGAMCEPVSVARHAVEKLGDLTGKRVLISGAGPIGLTAGKWCMAKGASAVYLFDIDARKMDFAKTLGFFEFNGEAVDVGIEGTGASPALARCITALGGGSKLVLMGNPAREVQLSAADYQYILRKELTLIGTWNSAYGEVENDWRESIKAMADGVIDPTDLITHKFKLEDYEKAFSLICERREFFNKVLFEME